MKKLAILAMLWSGLSAAAALNPLNFSRQQLGKAPAGFVPVNSEATEWTVIKAKVPSTLDPTQLVDRHCLKHRGGTPDTKRYPALLLDHRDYDDLILKTSFQITGGSGVKAAGVVFRTQKDNSAILFAIIPEKENMYLKFCEKGVPVGGPESRIKIPKDGWYHLEISCRNNVINGRLNGESFDSIKLNDMPAGRVGFWTRGDTECLFAMSSLTLPLTLAQGAVNDITRANEHLKRMELIGQRRGADGLEIAAATNAALTGKAGPESCRPTLEKGAVVYSEDDDEVEIIMPVRDVEGDIIAAARMILSSGKLTTQARNRARASAVAIELGKRIQSRARLFR
ncbi:MAG: hypothetical protein CMO74_15460 [Verrucomicrobiales bacterium]|nr:hypothetical protein [Verrucomicrobiales bacterium]|tara:strand:+ start:856 stop:1875 length:1020 start_codon:yes stop_codon:yes gene_type:complete